MKIQEMMPEMPQTHSLSRLRRSRCFAQAMIYSSFPRRRESSRSKLLQPEGMGDRPR